eukprot:TRINITY_DN19480_c0_g1_i1.p1 TRINITY_DN19480_c0_g1~~TRINITY_DN19480_c0_g1_i1.p1  ORF type:complete len:350 (+),score=48.91 TRINITY_DN19480_c0_g1_i1:65-1114(+)
MVLISDEVKLALSGCDPGRAYLLFGLERGNDVVVCGGVPVAGANVSEWRENADLQIDEVNKLLCSGMHVVAIGCSKSNIFKIGSTRRYIDTFSMVYHDCTSDNQTASTSTTPIDISKYITVSGRSSTTSVTGSASLNIKRYRDNDRDCLEEAVNTIKGNLVTRAEMAVIETKADHSIESFMIPDVIPGKEDPLSEAVQTNETLIISITVPLGNISGIGETLKSACNSVKADVKNNIVSCIDECLEGLGTLPKDPNDLKFTVPVRKTVTIQPSSLRGYTNWHGYGSASDIKANFEEIIGTSEIVISNSEGSGGSSEAAPAWVFAILSVILLVSTVMILSAGMSADAEVEL